MMFLAGFSSLLYKTSKKVTKEKWLDSFAIFVNFILCCCSVLQKVYLYRVRKQTIKA